MGRRPRVSDSSVDFASRHPMSYAANEGIGITPAHPFDNAIHLDVVDGNVRRGQTHPEWANMVGPFGGITAAALVHAIETHPDRIGEPLALTVNFAAPIADGDFDISLRAPRTNRTNQHWILELSQGGEIKTTATAVFGIRRDTWANTETHPPTAPPPEQLIPGGPPDFIVWGPRYDMRFARAPSPAKTHHPTGHRRARCGRATALNAPSTTRPWPRCVTSSTRECSCAAADSSRPGPSR